MAKHTRDQSTENAEETLPTIEEMSGLIKTFSPPPDAEHTPGPWYASSYDGWEWEGHCIRDAHGQIIAKLALNVPGDANARLIAAAPELLAALEQALAVIGSDEMRLACDMADLHGMPYRGPTVDRAAMRNLIARVRGETASE